MPLIKRKHKTSKRKVVKNRRTRKRTTKRKTNKRPLRMRGGLFSHGTQIPEGAVRIVTIEGVPTSVSDEEYKKYQNGTYEIDL